MPEALTFVASGIDGFLLVIAALCFLVGAVVAWARAGHRAVAVLACAGLLTWVLASLIH